MANILIVDDSRTSRKIIRAMVEEMGHRVIAEADNGEDGFLKFKEWKPDLVTLDITMPGMNGLEALRLMMNEDKNAKVIMVSSAWQKNNMLKAIKLGAKDFLAKPVEEDILQLTITEILRKSGEEDLQVLAVEKEPV